MADQPRMLIVPPGAGEQHWQPQPANGWIEVLTSPRLTGAPAGFSAGLQELPPLGKIREHAHPAQTEIFWVMAGEALARLARRSLKIRNWCAGPRQKWTFPINSRRDLPSNRLTYVFSVTQFSTGRLHGLIPRRLVNT